MDGINMVTITGQLGADPELRMAQGGLAILKLRVATNEVWFDKERKKQERTEWHRVTVFGARAEGLAKFMRKGMAVTIVGSLRTSSYDKEGQKHYSTEIIANQIAVAPKGGAALDAASAGGLDASLGSFDTPPASYGANGRSSTGRSAPAAPSASDIPF